VIACDMPLGALVADGKDAEGRRRWENAANGDGPPLGRELEFAELFRSMRQTGVRNTVWLTADVHHTSAIYYDPGKAQFTEFDPFWEFISGPLNAGTFGPSSLDNTFGPQVRYVKAPPRGQSNLPPSAGLQFFGEVEIDDKSREMTVRLLNVAGDVLFAQRLSPA
jgi:alkaline phosphatase D